MTTHSPAPWKLCSNEQDQDFKIIGADSLPVATMATTISSKSAKWSNKKYKPKELWLSVANEREQANAKLISAAPDLLAICEELFEAAAYWSEYDVPLGIVDRLLAAIQKAT